MLIAGLLLSLLSLNLKDMSKINEIWKPVIGFEALYEVSNLGNIKSLRAGKVLKRIINNHGYCRVGLYSKNKYSQFQVHRLVAIHFIPNPENKPCINHKDSNKLNNHYSNLEWVTIAENIHHNMRVNRHPHGETCGAAILTEKQVLSIREEYSTGRIGTRLLAKKLGISRGCLMGVIKRRNWKHV